MLHYRRHSPAYHPAPQQAPVRLGEWASYAPRLPLVLLARLVVGLVWLLRGLGQLLVVINRCGTPAARADHR